MTSVLPRPGLTKADHGRTLRLDIEGMRAVAVGVVLAFHAGLPKVEGGFVGVDVFFVLSGFLITGLLAREVARTGRVRIAHFWARRVKRLLPASATVLVFSAFVTYAYLPVTQREAFGGDIVSAALYVVNWRLADRSVDYLAEDVGASPVQHYWSLSVEEQFYVVWPLLMLLVAVVAARRWRLGAFAVLGVVTAASFAFSVAQSQSAPGTAFFVSTTRVWELGVGALLALSTSHVARLPPLLRAVGGWVGLVMIAYAVLRFDGSTTWPGTAAALPVAGAALLIASGITTTAGSPQRLLSARPMVWIGGLSYSIYLWHWPLLIAAQAQHPDLRLRWTVLLMVASILPAWVCHVLIENPARFGTAFRPTGRALGLGAALTALGVGAGLALHASVALSGAVQEASVAESPGAAAIDDPANRGVVWSDVTSVDRLRPLPTDALEDRPPSYDNGSGCQVAIGNPEPKVCELGDLDADRTVVLVGDSKIAQWETVVDRIADREGWRVLTITANGCAFTDAAITGGNRVLQECRQWGREALRLVVGAQPELVLTSMRFQTALPPGKTEGRVRTRAAMVEGLQSYWTRIRDGGSRLVVVLDNPMPTTNPVYQCVADNPDDLPACAFDERKGIADSAAPAQREAARRVPGVGVVDMTDTICPDAGRCAAVIGNVLVYRAGSHLTRSFVETAEPDLAARLDEATDGAFGARSHR